MLGRVLQAQHSRKAALSVAASLGHLGAVKILLEVGALLDDESNVSRLGRVVHRHQCTPRPVR